MPKQSKLEKYENQEGSWFCAVTHDLSLAEKIKMTILDFPSWAWIYHDPDNEDGTPHVHFLIRSNGTRKIKHIANKIDLPSNFIQICRSEVGYRRYMMHLDSPDKIKYKVSDVHTNCHSDFRSAERGDQPASDIFALYRDFRRLQDGLISPNDFIGEHFLEMEKMPFGQKIKTFQVLEETWCIHHAHT